jgi:hypothetical protein
MRATVPSRERVTGMLVVSGFWTRVGKWDHGREHVGKLSTAEDAKPEQRAQRKPTPKT